MPPSDKIWTIKSLLAWCTPFLKSKDVDSAQLDSEILLAHVLGQERVYLIMHADEEVMPVLLQEFKALIQRRAEREPISSLIEKKAFFREEYFVNKDVLSPRPESEFLVEGLLEHFPEEGLVADVGTGSGCLLVSLLASNKKLRAVGIDLSPAALNVAQKNAESNQVSDRCLFVLSDHLSALPDNIFDGLISNPPYVCRGDIEKLMPEVKNHDPHMALDGGDDGLDCYRKWLPEMRRVLKPGGQLGLEVGIGQNVMVQSLAEGIGLIHEKTTTDYSGVKRSVWFSVPALS